MINDLATDQRVGRVAKMLSEQGVNVTCIGRKLKGSPSLENRPFRVRRYRMLFTRGPLFYACFNMRLLLTLLIVKRPSLFISNDLDTLPANFLAGRIRSVPLIYDSHELFTQVPELIERKTVFTGSGRHFLSGFETVSLVAGLHERPTIQRRPSSVSDQ